LTFPKRFVNTFCVDEVRQRLDALRAFRPVARCVSYESIEVGPLSVKLHTSIPQATTPPTAASTTPRRGPSSNSSNSSNGRIKEWGPLPRHLLEADAKAIIQQLVRILFSFYRRRFVCSTISTATVLYDRNTSEVLLTQHVLPPSFFVRGSTLQQEQLRQCAPEVLANQPYGFPSDVWALGVLLLSLTGSSQIDTDDVVDTNVTSPLVNHLSPSAVSFACQCLKASPDLRPSITDLLMHPFLVDGSDKFDQESVTSSRWQSDEEEEEDDEEQNDEGSRSEESGGRSQGSR
jgi:hypothetical protein